MAQSYDSKKRWQRWLSFDFDYDDQKDENYARAIQDLIDSGVDFSGLSQSEIEALISSYWEEVERPFKTVNTFDKERFLSDYGYMKDAIGSMPQVPDTDQLWNDAKARADLEAQAALDELAGIHSTQVSNFNDELSSLASSYNTSRNAILSSQYQQNAQLMDNMTSQLDKQNRNALEAGASAGMRLAGNINTLLSTQNKQSQTSLETANQLAQMMVNQRNAEASVRGRYGDYLNQNFNARQNIKNSAFNKAQSYYDREYDIANNAYTQNLQNWDNANKDNPLWESRYSFQKNSKYGKPATDT